MAFQSFDWDNDGGYFHPKENQPDDSPRGYAIRAIKRELVYRGFTFPRMVDNGFYGTNMAPHVKSFQQQEGLTPDGVIGPRTMKALCRVRVAEWEQKVGVPDHLMCRTIDLESAWYPACRNTTEDYGISQIHDPLSAKFADGSDVCPGDDWQYAYRIGVNVKYLAEHMRRNHHHLAALASESGISDDNVWRATVMAHNAPAWAEEWMLAGFPVSGGGMVTVGDWHGQKFEWATLYTNAVYARSC